MEKLNRNLVFITLFQVVIMALTLQVSEVSASITDEILDSDDIFTRMEELDMQRRIELFEDIKHIESQEIDPPEHTVQQDWKCDETDLLVCLYRLGKEGIYDLSAEQFFSYFSKSEYELIEDYFESLRISKQSRFVKLEFFLKDVKSIKFSLLGDEYPRVAIKHRGTMIIEQTDISKVSLVKYPHWFNRLLPLKVKMKLVDVDDNLRIKMKRWASPSVDRKVTVQNIHLHQIEFVKDQLQGFGAKLDKISVINMENHEQLEKIFLLKGSYFYLPTIKGLRKNTLFKTQLTSNEL
jgi:hypothetical protein